MTNRAATLAVLLSAASMLAAGYAVFRSPPSEPSACACDREGQEGALAAIQRRIEALEQRDLHGRLRRAADAGQHSGSSPAVGGGGGSGEIDAVDPDAPDAEPRATPRFTSFEVSEPGVTVSQNESGAISLQNTNASLVGEVLTVKARGEDGEVRELTVTVPPVE